MHFPVVVGWHFVVADEFPVKGGRFGNAEPFDDLGYGQIGGDEQLRRTADQRPVDIVFRCASDQLLKDLAEIGFAHIARLRHAVHGGHATSENGVGDVAEGGEDHFQVAGGKDIDRGLALRAETGKPDQKPDDIGAQQFRTVFAGGGKRFVDDIVDHCHQLRVALWGEDAAGGHLAVDERDDELRVDLQVFAGDLQKLKACEMPQAVGAFRGGDVVMR